MTKEIPTTDIVTLTKLAAQSRFVSVRHSLPEDVTVADWLIKLDGKAVLDTQTDKPFEGSLNILEAYVGEDGKPGWVVHYPEGGNGKTELAEGIVEIERVNDGPSDN